MDDRLLITLRGKRHMHTTLLDATARSLVWCGMEEDVLPKDALCSVELTEKGVVVRPREHVTISLRDNPGIPGEPISIRPGVDALLHLTCAPANDVASLYIRRACNGIGEFERLLFQQGVELVVGRRKSCDIRYGNAFVSGCHVRISYDGHSLSVTDLKSANGTFVNGCQLQALQPRILVPGDTVQVLDLTIMAGRGLVLINKPDGLVMGTVDGTRWDPRVPCALPKDDMAWQEGEDAVFYPSPRISKTIRPLVLEVDAPPAKKEQSDSPAIMQVGPSFLMGLASACMVANSVLGIAGGTGIAQALPSLAMAVAMMGGMLVWPIVSRAYRKRRDEADEARRVGLYMAYLDSVENALLQAADEQASILRENRVPVQRLLSFAQERSPQLMNRTGANDDFLDLRVGVGDCELASELTWPQKHFSLDEDPMASAVDALASNPTRLCDVPVAYNPAKHYVAGIVGDRALVWEFVRGLLVQVCAFYSYRDVSVVLVADEREREEWGFVTSLRHAYDQTGLQRMVALTPDGLARINSMLGSVLRARSKEHAEALEDYGTYYLVVCASVALAKRSETLASLGRLRTNRGCSIVYMSKSVHELPRDCSYIVDLSPDGSAGASDAWVADKETTSHSARMFERTDVLGTLRTFDPDITVTKEEARAFGLHMASVRMEAPDQRRSTPESMGFLEMFSCGCAQHLNVGRRWEQNDASRSLKAPIGMDEQGDLVFLNLHESVHGPHGLVAGTTGSGKSELIITLVLSMCVNYAPDEVSFVLLDYKGGGLAGAFCNERRRLPHLAGTITNLDGSSIRRSLVSIRSELKRRQAMFNDARNVTGEATMDIYKYLSFYRQGILKEPLPHLVIVADEFAELKQQEPEFMDELVSAARIGRSLGIHLVLATQKPSGVVDDQIWSNARFKVCLKVSDAADSREMIRREDAAGLRRPGQFFLLVGYSELFVAGQAAYAGMPYAPKDHFEPRRDNAVELLDAEGSPLACLRPPAPTAKTRESEFDATLLEIQRASETLGKRARSLWLEALPACVTLDDLDRCYGSFCPKELSCVIGEADDPANQRRYRLEADLKKAGNVLLYGSQASGVEGLLAAALLSMAKAYASDTLWTYGIDLGTGMLGMLECLPHMGGVVRADDHEGIRSLLRLLETELTRRRRASSPKGSGMLPEQRQVARHPFLVVAIANISAMDEVCDDVGERLVSLTRDAPRHGIHVVATASSVNEVRMRLRANFGVEIPTMLNDANDYVSILGSLRGTEAPQQERRGLVRENGSLYEFQGASIAADPQCEQSVVQRVAKDSRLRCSDVPARIPRLPRHVLSRHMVADVNEARFPVGFSKSSIEPVCFDVRSSDLLVLANDAESLVRYLRGAYETLRECGMVRYRFVDPQHVLSTDDERVLTDVGAIESLVDELVGGTCDAHVVIFTSVVQTMARLGQSAGRKLQEYVVDHAGTDGIALVAATDYWRTKALYADWYKALSAEGNGIWVGSGFCDQTALSYARALPAYRVPAQRSDGFVAVGANVVPVRLVEPEVQEEVRFT